jgi:hypothetical protein
MTINCRELPHAKRMICLWLTRQFTVWDDVEKGYFVSLVLDMIDLGQRSYTHNKVLRGSIIDALKSAQISYRR